MLNDAMRGNLETVKDLIEEFGQWLNRNPSIEQDVEVSGSTSYYVDLGQFGENEIEVEYETETSASFDIEDAIRDEAPDSRLDSGDDFLDRANELEEIIAALDEMTATVSGAAIPAALNVREEMAGRAALAAVSVFLDGDGEDALRRALGDALTRAGFSGSAAAEIETILKGVRSDALKPGDVLVDTFGGGANARRVNGGRVTSIGPATAAGDLIPVRVVKDGIEESANFNTYRLWQVSRMVSGAVADLGYDPLTVPVSGSSGTEVQYLRLGDDVTGQNFGRVSRIESVDGDQVRLVLNRDGTENVKVVQRSTFYSILGIAPEGIERSEVPTALSLFESRAASTAVAV